MSTFEKGNIDAPLPQENIRYVSINDNVTPISCLGFKIKYKAFQETQILLFVLGVIVTGAANRVASKIMTVPMGPFSFFLGLFNAVVYVVVYFSILLIRYLLNIVPKSQFTYVWTHKYTKKSLWSMISPWKYFLIMGLMDGLGNILGLIATPYLDGPIISLLSQTIVIFSVICALIILRTTYSFWQIWTVCLLLCGVVVTLMPTFSGGPLNSNILYSLVMAFSTLPNAISFTYKELLFRENPDLDIFIINSHGSLFQLLLQPIFLPLTILFNQTNGKSLLDYIVDGFECFGGNVPLGVNAPCEHNPYPYLVYICINLAFNILLLLVTKRVSALLSFMAIKAVLPMSVLLFYFPWPLLKATPVNTLDLIGLVIIVVALVLYRMATIQKNDNDLPCMSLTLPFLEKSTYFKIN